MNKKGYIFELVLVIFTFLTLVSLTYFVINDPFAGKRSTYKELGLGIPALTLFKTYNEAERALLYIDTASLFSAQKAAAQLARGGGFIESSPCGTITDAADKIVYNLWHSKDNVCVPEYKKNFLSLLDSNLGPYLQSYPHLKLPTSYNFYASNGRVVSSSKQMLGITKNDPFQITYKVEPSSNIQTAYGIEEYAALKAKQDKIISRCSGLECIKKDIATNAKFSWSLQNCDFTGYIACFNIISPTQLGGNQIVYRLASYIDFPKIKVDNIYDNLRAGKSIIVHFQASQKTDNEEYIVYLSKDPQIKDIIARGGQVSSARIPINEMIPVTYTMKPTFESCDASGMGGCTYGTSAVFEPNKAYIHEDDIYYVISDPNIIDGSPTYVAIVAANNEKRLSEVSETVLGVSVSDPAASNP